MDEAEARERRARDEFARQAPHFATAPALRRAEVLDRIARAVAAGPETRVLDAACGTGDVSARLAPEARRVVGVDLTPEMLAQARLRCAEVPQASLVRGRIEALPLRAGAFDAVVSRLALHHFADPSAALDAMLAAVRPGGTLVVADLVASEDPAEAAAHDALEILRDPSHVRLLPISEHRALVAERGLEIASVETWTQPRRAAEWLAITGAARERRAVVYERLAAHVAAGETLGIALRGDGDDYSFLHRWMVLCARR